MYSVREEISSGAAVPGSYSFSYFYHFVTIMPHLLITAPPQRHLLSCSVNWKWNLIENITAINCRAYIVTLSTDQPVIFPFINRITRERSNSLLRALQVCLHHHQESIYWWSSLNSCLRYFIVTIGTFHFSLCRPGSVFSLIVCEYSSTVSRVCVGLMIPRYFIILQSNKDWNLMINNAFLLWHFCFEHQLRLTYTSRGRNSLFN